ncbi:MULTISPECIES: branched-chain amino acid ABC transporter permease [Haloferax]|uniref:Branched-chain amino acid ABC transporter permease n=1 Tax=Haloferax marinum TaxID=2666143 RepID=A0A6A8GAC5_9EURY|nr:MULTISPECIES: branched-chain amino acid ABC transporter permease [Haloferax]KAB1198840.1 branched-chain amino acid ABC transporter permease [Haloferax sp. CBA1150]MRW97961.1 branched-chain amino acid ABC transporter permease [Haloferax marinum]
MSVKEDITARVPGGDTGLIVLVLASAYLLYLLAGIGLGYDLRGQLNSIATLTFYIGVFAMLSLALNLHWGYTGLFNIGIVGFMAVGVYVMALVSKPLYVAGGAAQVGGLGLPLWVGILAGMLAAAILGFVVALPALRLRADYLAIVTIAMSEIVRFSFLSGDLQAFSLMGTRVGFGGGSGLILDFTPPLEALFQAFGLWGVYNGLVDAFRAIVPTNPKPVVDGLIYGLLLLGFVVAFYWLLKRTGESPFGRVLKAIREDEDVANALGKNTDGFKIKSFMLGCALMGLAGILWLMPQGAVTPNFFRPRVTFFVWIALIIGGAGSNTGSVLGGAVFAAVLYQGPRYFQNLVSTVFPNLDSPSGFGQAISPLISSFDPVPFLLYTIDSIRQLQLVVMGLVLIWLMHNRPEGLLGHRKETASVIPLSRPKSMVAADGGADESVRTDGGVDEGDSTVDRESNGGVDDE